MLKIISTKATQPRATETFRPTHPAGALTRRLHALRTAAIKIPRVVCPQCGGKMRFALLEPYSRPDSRKEITTFTCACGEEFSYTLAPHL
jgi:RNase P subunit RPR2